MKNILSSCLLSMSLCFVASTASYATADTVGNTNAVVMAKILDFPISQDVLDRVQEKTGFSAEKVAVLATELKRYFVLSTLEKNVPMFSSDVDEVWHAFILFTKEYQQFCKQNVGYFLHHAPTTKAEKLVRTPEANKAEREKFIALYTKCFGVAPDQEIWFPGANDCRSCTKDNDCRTCDKSCGRSCGIDKVSDCSNNCRSCTVNTVNKEQSAKKCWSECRIQCSKCDSQHTSD